MQAGRETLTTRHSLVAPTPHSTPEVKDLILDQNEKDLPFLRHRLIINNFLQEKAVEATKQEKERKEEKT
jgi:hypothetical protein